jgi:hypothetical protein
MCFDVIRQVRTLVATGLVWLASKFGILSWITAVIIQNFTSSCHLSFVIKKQGQTCKTFFAHLFTRFSFPNSFKNFSLFAERAVFPLDVFTIHFSPTTLTCLSAIAELFVTCLWIASAMMMTSSVARENQANGMFPHLSWIYCAGVKIMDNSNSVNHRFD